MQSRSILRYFNKKAPKTSSHVLLFPGQGSQYVGMTEKLSSKPVVAPIFRTAERVLGYDLRELCLAGPQSRLDETVHCQPTVTAASLAAAENLKEDAPEIVAGCKAVAGFSVGEVTALMFTEALSLEAGFRLIQTRAAAMHRCCLQRRGAMLTVTGLPDHHLQRLCRDTSKSTANTVCIANFIFPKGYVISGAAEAVQLVGTRAQEEGATIKRVAVSGAFHSQLMEPAVEEIRSLLKTLDINLPRIPVYSGVTGQPYTTANEIRESLAVQVIRPVLWESVLQRILQDVPCVQFVQLGPGEQLKAMLRRIDKDAYKQCQAISV